MPDYAERPKFEAAIVRSLRAPFQTAEQSASDGSVDWVRLETEVRTAISDDLLRVFVAVYLFMMADDDLGTSAALLAKSWSTATAGRLATGFAGAAQKRLKAGAAPSIVFGKQAAAGIAATEVTRAISSAETEARRATVTSDGGGRSGDDRGEPVAPLDVPDGLLAIWWTERDGKVCKICRPLHKQPYGIWVNVAPFGPPAHPRCRCWVVYQPLAESLLGRFSRGFRESVARVAAFLRL